MELTRDYDKLTHFKPLLSVVANFFKKTGIKPDTADIQAWFNPNSLTPDRTQEFYNNLQNMEEGTSFAETLNRLFRTPAGDKLAAS